MKWTKEALYTPIEKAADGFLKELREKVDACPWRQAYHIQPETGLLNDPNGFSYFNGRYHLFYQWFPLGPVHGLKYWRHLTSTDLVDWEDLGTALKPDTKMDSHGAYSGSGIVKDGELYLMYTGNHRDENWVRIPTQLLAKVSPDGSIAKHPEPVIPHVPQGYTEHFRDPKVWESDGSYYAIIGAQRADQTGCAVLYQSKDLHHWTFLGELQSENNNFGYMWECPDYFEINGNGVLVFSPQGLDPIGNSCNNIYQSGYMVGEKLNLPSLEWSHQRFVELDQGFDFYAPQTMEDPNGRRILVAWMGLPDISYPTDENGWASVMTLPRELSLKNGKLYQKPISELESLRKSSHTIERKLKCETFQSGSGKHYELQCAFNQKSGCCGLNLRVGNGEKTVFTWDCQQKTLTLDRSRSGIIPAADFGTQRTVSYEKDHLDLRIFMDSSSIEIFVNEGEEVFSARIFPTNPQNGIELFATDTCRAKLTKYEVI